MSFFPSQQPLLLAIAYSWPASITQSEKFNFSFLSQILDKTLDVFSRTLWISSFCFSKAFNLSSPPLSIRQLPTHHVAVPYKHVAFSSLPLPHFCSLCSCGGLQLTCPTVLHFINNKPVLSSSYPSILNPFTKEIKNPENGT